MNDQSVRKYFFFALFLLGISLVTFILWPFGKVIILSIALSAVLFPIYKFLNKHTRVPWVASFLTVLFFLIVLCVPLFFIGTMVFNQAQNIYVWVGNHGGLDNITQIFNRSIENIFPGGTINLKEGVSTITQNFVSSIGTAFTATVSTLLSLILVIISLFYFLKDGTSWKKTLVEFSPISDEGGIKIFNKLATSVNGIVKGYLLIAIAQGLLMGIGLAIFKVPNPALWGVLAAIASLVPTVGTTLVAVPAILFLLISGRTGAGIGFAIWALALVGTIDNFLNPYFVGKKIDIHPLLVLFSVLGGIALMGPIGILIGPLSISFIYALSSVYKSETSSFN